jgi:fructose-1,6-bisphosphatase I
MSGKINKVITLGQFIIERQNDFPFAKGELSRLLRDIGIAAKIVNREVNKAGLADILGAAGDENVHGEEVSVAGRPRLSAIASRKRLFCEANRAESCSAFSSERSSRKKGSTAALNLPARMISGSTSSLSSNPLKYITSM